MLKIVQGNLFRILIEYRITVNNICFFFRKPQYCLANDLPLNLFDCQFENVNWIIEDESISEVISSLQCSWATYMIK